MQILLVEDDSSTCSILTQSLTAHHYQVNTAADGQTGLEMAQQYEYDLILLDIELPRLDGMRLCQKLRSQGYVNPVLLLTARDSTSDRILGLDAGADDYVVKPFDIEELLARVRALLRRGKAIDNSVITWENLRFDAANSQVVAIHASSEHLLHLTPKEYGLLELLLLHPKRVFSRSAILDRLWDLAEAPGEETVSTHIKCLRQKLKAAGVADLIETVHGMGYRLRPPSASPAPTPPQANQPQQAISKQAISKQAISKQAIHREQVKAITARVWQRSKQQFIEHMQILEQAVTGLENDNLTPELRQQAKQAAHKLAGSLGMFGLSNGSDLAKHLEDWLQPQIWLDSTQFAHLKQTVQELYQIIQPQAIQPQDSDAQSQHGSTTQIGFSLCPSLPISTDFQNPKPPLVLVIDTNQPLIHQLQTQAPDWGIQIEVAADLAAARAILQERPPEVILLNLNLSGITPELWTELRQLTQPIPLLALTTRDRLQDRLAAAQLGNCLVLQQPLPLDTIRAAIMRSLQQPNMPVNRVMVVDDEDTVIAYLTALLQPLGIEVIGVSRPQDFWQMLQQTAPSLVILDLEMPDLDGLQLCRVVRSDLYWSRLPIVFLSSHSQSEQIDQAFIAGADDYLSKSAAAHEVTERIVRRLKRAGFREQTGKDIEECIEQ
ncbi:MAG: response regulator [Elainella sp. C42_A2020_010]|nr:response regulator [Elainella sp. C42_A2020_010]